MSMIRWPKFPWLVLACMLAMPVAGYTQNQETTTGGMRVFYGVVPAEVLGKGKSAQAPNGPGPNRPRGRNIQHLVVALLDPQTGRRIQNATVMATVTPLGLAAEQKKLAPMLINGDVTYRNFFHFPPGSAPFRIEIDIQRPGSVDHGRARAEFFYTPPDGSGRSR